MVGQGHKPFIIAEMSGNHNQSLERALAIVDAAADTGADAIKLKKDQTGQHHYIPLSWVTSTADGKVQVDRPGQDAMNDWMTTPTIQ